MYADYEYYKDHFTAVIPEGEFNNYSQRASDVLDYLTRGRLVDNLPSSETDLGRVKRACCAVADKIYAVTRRTAELASNGGIAVKSVSSGGESMTFELSEMDLAINGGEKALMRFYYNVAKVYLSMVGDDHGQLYLYWGI